MASVLRSSVGASSSAAASPVLSMCCDAVAGLLLAAQAHERLALEVEQVCSPSRCVAPGRRRRDSTCAIFSPMSLSCARWRSRPTRTCCDPDQEAGAARCRRRPDRLVADRAGPSPPRPARWPAVLASAMTRSRLNTIGRSGAGSPSSRASAADVATLACADGLEARGGSTGSGSPSGTWAAQAEARADDLLRPPPAGMRPDAHLDQADVASRRRPTVAAPCMAHLAAAAQRHAVGRDDHRAWRRGASAIIVCWNVPTSVLELVPLAAGRPGPGS